MISGLCKFCHGYGNVMTIQNGRYLFEVCPFCSGYGTRNEYRGEPYIKMHSK